MIDDASRKQLTALADIGSALGSQRVRFWLRGGWALDFVHGRVTRPHADIDIVLWDRHRRRAHEALGEAGFMLDRELPIQTDWVRDGVEITFIYVRKRSNRTIVTTGVSEDQEWRWMPDAFPGRVHMLHGVRARVVNPRQLLNDLEEWESATGRPLRPKDYETRRVLRELCGLSAEG
jgi:hypothetical protein